MQILRGLFILSIFLLFNPAYAEHNAAYCGPIAKLEKHTGKSIGGFTVAIEIREIYSENYGLTVLGDPADFTSNQGVPVNEMSVYYAAASAEYVIGSKHKDWHRKVDSWYNRVKNAKPKTHFCVNGRWGGSRSTNERGELNQEGWYKLIGLYSDDIESLNYKSSYSSLYGEEVD